MMARQMSKAAADEAIGSSGTIVKTARLLMELSRLNRPCKMIPQAEERQEISRGCCWEAKDARAGQREWMPSLRGNSEHCRLVTRFTTWQRHRNCLNSNATCMSSVITSMSYQCSYSMIGNCRATRFSTCIPRSFPFVLACNT